MAARTLLLKLHQRGWIVLPPRRSLPLQSIKRPTRTEILPVESPAIIEPLSRLLPVTLTELSTGGTPTERRLFSALLCAHHYLEHRGHVGENLQYLARDPQGRPLACVLFGAPAWQCAPRDEYIGWDGQARPRHLHWVTNNTRLLLLPWVKVPQLASHLLSQIARQISPHWHRKYGHRIYLLESFVQCDRFLGTAYQAANWVRVGQTKGRSRQDQPDGGHSHLPIKDIYLYPLHPRFREWLQGKGTSTNPSPHSHSPQNL